MNKLQEGVDFTLKLKGYQRLDLDPFIELVSEDLNTSVGLYYDPKPDTITMSCDWLDNLLLFDRQHLIDILSKLKPIKNAIVEATKELLEKRQPARISTIKRYLCVRGIIQDDLHVLTLNAILMNAPEFYVADNNDEFFRFKMWRLK